jgi:hypothetical protein
MAWLAVNLNITAVFTDNPVRNGEPKARSFTQWLRRKKGIKHFLQILLGYA